MTGVPVHTH